MRKLFRISALAALALGMTALTAEAQRAKTFGIVAGVDFANVSGDDISEGTSSKTGFMGGFFVGLPIGTNVDIEPEILYAMKGAKYDNEFFKGQYKFDYIEIPVLFKYNFQPEGGVYALAGPAVGFNVSCKDQGDYVGSLVTSTGRNPALSLSSAAYDYDESCEDQGAKANTTFGGVLGLGFKKGRVGIEGRYDFDFGDAIQDKETGENYNVKNNVWAILIRLSK